MRGFIGRLSLTLVVLAAIMQTGYLLALSDLQAQDPSGLQVLINVMSLTPPVLVLLGVFISVAVWDENVFKHMPAWFWLCSPYLVPACLAAVISWACYMLSKSLVNGFWWLATGQRLFI